ncbi:MULTISPECIES: DNA methyltransferase [Haloferacaceae]|uniref:DNA methyltransferase n=2 Tax=Haloferacaceae TaxID=1644056 RepID=A0ABD6DEG4_9EURY|nr:MULTISPECIES: DNA methyltransferase [Halorubraceae]
MQSTLTATTDYRPGLEDRDWSFKGATTDYGTHDLHKYPARMIPQIPDALFEHWTHTGTLSEGDLVFDPFSGSGTTAAEARRHGLNAIATDINPFACLLSRTKSTVPDLDTLESAIRQCLGTDWATREQFIEENYQSAASQHRTKHGGDIYTEDSGDQNYNAYGVRKGWFPEPQLAKITAMSRQLSELRAEYDHEVIRFIRIALAQAARNISYQRDSEFKRHRIPEADRESHDPKFTETFIETLRENFYGLVDYATQVSDETTATIKYADCRDTSVLAPDSADAVVSSPPYGDHSTTVAYGGFSTDPAAVATPLKLDQMTDVDPSGLGGSKTTSDIEFATVSEWSPTLRATVDALKDVDGRDDDVLHFFADYAETLEQMARVVKPGQPVAIVLGNRTVSRVPIPMNVITIEIAQQFQLDLEHSLPRSIPSKTLPYENAPENIPGQTGGLIADEYVLIFRAGQ